jgi:hypothetical protein
MSRNDLVRGNNWQTSSQGFGDNHAPSIPPRWEKENILAHEGINPFS